MTTCKWCGKPLKKRKSNAQKYHKKCEKHATLELAIKRQMRAYRYNKENEIQTFSQYKRTLGTGSLSSNHNSEYAEEHKAIQKELERLKIF